MGDVIFYGVPILWAGVAVAVALILYKTSEAAFEGDSFLGVPAKGLRLTGSIVVFAIVLVLLQRVTLGNASMRADPTKAQVDRGDLREMRRLATAVETVASDALSCRQLDTPLAQCAADVGEMHENARRLRELLEPIADASRDAP